MQDDSFGSSIVCQTSRAPHLAVWAVSCQPLSTTDCFHMLEVPQGSSVAVQLSKAITLFSWLCISVVVDCFIFFLINLIYDQAALMLIHTAAYSTASSAVCRWLLFAGRSAMHARHNFQDPYLCACDCWPQCERLVILM